MSVLFDICCDIDELAKKQYGWDGKDALPIRHDVYEYADRTLFCLNLASCVNREALERCDQPHVTLVEDGTLVITFKRDDESKELILSIPCGGIVTYSKVFEDGQTEVEGIIRSQRSRGIERVYEKAHEIDDLLKWYAQE